MRRYFQSRPVLLSPFAFQIMSNLVSAGEFPALCFDQTVHQSEPAVRGTGVRSIRMGELPNPHPRTMAIGPPSGRA